MNYDVITTRQRRIISPNEGFFGTIIQSPIQTMITGLMTDGVWQKLDRLWIFAQPTATLALTDLVAYKAATNQGTVFTANRGFAGDGATTYIDTGYTPSVNGVNYTMNSGHVSVYDRTAVGDGNYQIGSNDGSSALLLQVGTGNASGQFFGEINDVGPLGAGPSNFPAGMFVMTRTGATTSNAYNNGSFIGASANASVSVTATDVWICGSNIFGLLHPTSDQIAAVSIGGGLSATDAANLSTRINNYMKAVGANVY